MHLQVVRQRMTAILSNEDDSEKVWARWSDGLYYKGDVEEVFPERNACRITFFDVCFSSFVDGAYLIM
jgi:hypothetical protein